MSVLEPSWVCKLPLVMRCCYHLAPWTAAVTLATVDEWAAHVGWVAFYHDDPDRPPALDVEEATTRAILEASRLFAFATDLLSEVGGEFL